jgi:uncharacterized protein
MFIYLSLIAVFFSSLVYGIIGFADALILIPIITPIIGIKDSVILVNLWGTITSTVNFIKYRHLLDKSYFLRFLSLGVPATILGTFLIIDLQFEWIELIFGLFVFVYASIKLAKYFFRVTSALDSRDLNNKSNLIIFGGFSYGILSGLISAAGPLNVALLEHTGHYKENFIENFAAVGSVLSFSRIPFYFIGNIFPYELVLVLLLGIPIIYIATRLGHKITPKISSTLFQITIFCFLLIMSLKSILLSLIGLFSLVIVHI